MLKNKVLTGMMLLILVMIPTMVMAGDMQREKGMHGKSDLPMGKWWENPEMAKKLKIGRASCRERV